MVNVYLLTIFIISIAGILFSGFLSYRELFCNKGCSLGQKIAGIPVCVYGLLMYLIIFVISLIGILQ